MLIRRLVPTDAPAYLALRLAALRESPTAFSSSFEEERDSALASIAARLAPGSGRIVLGALEGDVLAGMLVLGREEGLKVRHKGFLRGIYVAPEFRGRGTARQMMVQALAAARSMDGLLQLTLTVTAGNAAALALYQSLGFAVYGQAPRALCVDGVFYDDIHMALDPL